MIPENIKKEHILKAIEKIERARIPKGRESKKFSLIFKEEQYPPKYVLSLANRFANGKELDPSDFSGGQETNNFLKWLGFDIVETPSSLTFVRPISAKNKTFEKIQKEHNERCPECKKTVEKMLREIFGKVESNYKFEVGTSPEEYRGFPFYQNLKEILLGLEKHRGHMDFVRTPTLPPCDFFVPKPGFIVEFDESQHFTLSRKISLQYYPSPQSPRLGFSLTRWIALCKKISAKDNDPPFRDEQRAWYDTLRDFVPELKGLEPTLRLYSREMKWCSLNPEKTEDIAKFRVLIENKRRKSNGWVATVVLQSNEKYSDHNRNRLKALSQIVDTVAKETDGGGVILFPGGWFTAGKQKAGNKYEWVEENARNILSIYERHIIICLGIDGRDDGRHAKDQIAIAISKKGIKAIGRKFCAAPGEKGHVELAKGHLSKEENKPRVFTLNGRKYFLCACYDCFGIRKEEIPNFGIDVILDLVHGFGGGYGKGHPYFAKHGFAGASKYWKRPVFGAAVFFHPIKPKNWPSGVYWNKGNKDIKKWKYKHNHIRPIKTKELNIKEGVASVRIYNIEAI